MLLHISTDVLHAPADQVELTADAQLGLDVEFVNTDRGGGDFELLGQLLMGEPLGVVLEQLLLPFSEWVSVHK